MAPLADYDPCNRLEALANRPLLLWHGEADEVVPWGGSGPVRCCASPLSRSALSSRTLSAQGQL